MSVRFSGSIECTCVRANYCSIGYIESMHMRIFSFCAVGNIPTSDGSGHVYTVAALSFIDRNQLLLCRNMPNSPSILSD